MSPPLLLLFLLWFHFFLLFIPLPFLCSAQVFYSLCFSFPLLLRRQFSSYRFLRCLQLQLRLFLPEPFLTYSNDIQFHLPFLLLSSLFKISRSAYVSFSNSKLSGKLSRLNSLFSFNTHYEYELKTTYWTVLFELVSISAYLSNELLKLFRRRKKLQSVFVSE